MNGKLPSWSFKPCFFFVIGRCEVGVCLFVLMGGLPNTPTTTSITTMVSLHSGKVLWQPISLKWVRMKNMILLWAGVHVEYYCEVFLYICALSSTCGTELLRLELKSILLKKKKKKKKEEEEETFKRGQKITSTRLFSFLLLQVKDHIFKVFLLIFIGCTHSECLTISFHNVLA